MDMDRLRTVASVAKPQRWEGLMDTIAETLIAENKAEWLAEGKAEGKAETLVKLLERRFGPVSHDVKGRILGASVTDLETWLDAILDARNLDAVFANTVPH